MNMETKNLLFVGSYTSAEKPGIFSFTFDSATGDMTPHGSFTGIASPSFLIIHPNEKWLYAVSETGKDSDGVYGSVHAFSIDHEQSSITIQHINQQSTDGDWPCHLQIDASGRWLVASNYGTGNAALFPILSDGSLGKMQTFLQHEGHGPNAARQEGPHAHSATFTPDNRFLIVADLGIDQLVIYKFDAEKGSLSPHTEIQTRPGAGPRHLAFHPDGRHVLVANELDSSVTVYEYNSENGILNSLQTLDTIPGDSPESTVADIHFSSTGKHVYVSNRGHNSIAVFSFDEDSRLTRLGIPSCGGNWPRNFTLSPDGEFMLVANRYSNQISVMPMLSGQTDIGEKITQAKIESPSCVRFVRNTLTQG